MNFTARLCPSAGQGASARETQKQRDEFLIFQEDLLQYKFIYLGELGATAVNFSNH